MTEKEAAMLECILIGDTGRLAPFFCFAGEGRVHPAFSGV